VDPKGHSDYTTQKRYDFIVKADLLNFKYEPFTIKYWGSKIIIKKEGLFQVRPAAARIIFYLKRKNR
jgi:hypothetical protein